MLRGAETRGGNLGGFQDAGIFTLLSEEISIETTNDSHSIPGRHRRRARTQRRVEVRSRVSQGARGGFRHRERRKCGGRSEITAKIAIDLLRSGVAVITTGDHVWDQRETASYISTEPRLLRPINYPNGAPGQGPRSGNSQGKVAVLNVQGRTFMQQILDNPFPAAMAEVERLRRETPVIIVDMHAETTSEKIAMGRFLDGKVSAVLGTHTHVQTADERIFPGGTAFICDVGMCGPDDSCLGRDHQPIIKRFIDGLPGHFPVAAGPVRLCGAS